jgi:glutathione peroxidase
VIGLAGLIASAACGQHSATPISPAVTPAQPEATPVDTTNDKYAEQPNAALGFTMLDITGKPVPMDEFAGHVVLFVNVATKCGLTPQYEGLQALFEKYEDEGLVVVGFPANNFGGQEPGTEAEILEFCTGTYDVTFPMFSKISVVGEDRHPLYAKIAEAMKEQGGEPTWNFTKYLIDREGNVVTRFDPRMSPSDAKFIDEVELLLAEPVPEGVKPAAGQDKETPA